MFASHNVERTGREPFLRAPTALNYARSWRLAVPPEDPHPNGSVRALDLAGTDGEASGSNLVVRQRVVEAGQVLEELSDALLAATLVGAQLAERCLYLSRVEQDDLVRDPAISLSVTEPDRVGGLEEVRAQMRPVEDEA